MVVLVLSSPAAFASFLLLLLLAINNIGEAFQYHLSSKSHQQPSSSSLYAISSSKSKATKKSNAKKSESAALIRTLQAECHTPSLLLSKVGSKLSPKNDANGKVSSLVLVRLAKFAVERTNAAMCEDRTVKSTETTKRSQALLHNNNLWDEDDDPNKAIDILRGVCSTLAISIASSEAADLDSGVEGIKAAGVLSRLLDLEHDNNDASSADSAAIFMPLVQNYSNVAIDKMEDHHLSGLRWAFDNLALCLNNGNATDDLLPKHINDSYRKLNLPFRIRPGLLSSISGLTVSALTSQVKFKAETIHTTSTDKSVKERRLTAWEGESSDIQGFAYSGKVMETSLFSPLVLAVRDELVRKTGVSYDCCLLNLYTDGESGMRYHIDPDQGTLWGHETVVVSVGATRKFSFRDIPGLTKDNGDDDTKSSKKTGIVHNFYVLDGDTTEMFADCQQKYQHTVKTSRGEKAARSSLVYKKTRRA